MAGALNIERAWHAVALEERLELISRAKAEGMTAALAFTLLMGTVAYGFDKIWILAGGALGSVLIAPLFSSYSWRRGRPQLILNYLAIRSIARRYAYGYHMPNLDIILIFRGLMKERFQSVEDEQRKQEEEEVDLESSPQPQKEVWVCLMRSAVVLLSPRLGGAKLEFISAVNAELVCRKPTSTDNAPEKSLILVSANPNPGKTILLTSPYPGALYVFEKQILRLIAEAIEAKRRLIAYAEESK